MAEWYTGEKACKAYGRGQENRLSGGRSARTYGGQEKKISVIGTKNSPGGLGGGGGWGGGGGGGGWGGGGTFSPFVSGRRKNCRNHVNSLATLGPRGLRQLESKKGVRSLFFAAGKC